MASRKVSILKFVGTVSLGLLTGASYSISAFAVPFLLELPSASTAAKAYRTVKESSTATLNTLAAASATTFLLAFGLSPSGFRHPYLVYTGLFCFATTATDLAAPYLFSHASASTSGSGDFAQRRAALANARREKQAAKRMEASYEVLGDSHSDGTSADAEEELINGEEVRGEVEAFSQRQWARTALTALAFGMSVVGIWGDGVRAAPVVIHRM